MSREADTAVPLERQFGTMASLAMTKNQRHPRRSMAHEENCDDGHTLPEVLEPADVVHG